MKITERRLRAIIKSVIKENSNSSSSTRRELQNAQDQQETFKDEYDLATLICGMNCAPDVLEAVAMVLRPHMSKSDLMSGDSQQMMYDDGGRIPLSLSQSADINALAYVIDAMKSGPFPR